MCIEEVCVPLLDSRDDDYLPTHTRTTHCSVCIILDSRHARWSRRSRPLFAAGWARFCKTGSRAGEQERALELENRREKGKRRTLGKKGKSGLAWPLPFFASFLSPSFLLSAIANKAAKNPLQFSIKPHHAFLTHSFNPQGQEGGQPGGQPGRLCM